MGQHTGQKRDSKKRHRAGFNEGRDIRIERARRVTFKNYVQSLEEELLEQELEELMYQLAEDAADE
jgi:hypothetical protein